MKTLVVFYSRTGLTKKVAEKLALILSADLEELSDQENRSGAIGYLKSGRDAMKKKLALISPLKYNPNDYDLVIIGTPTWAFNMACAIRTYLVEQKGKMKKIAFFATHGSDGAERAIKNMADLSGETPVATLTITSREAMKEDYNNKLDFFISELNK